MKIYISADIEGVAGICNWDEATQSHSDYTPFRQQMTREVRAACEGALASGASEVFVKDAHATGRNLLHQELPREVTLIRGWSGHPACMVQELDASFEALLLIGYHARAGAGGNPLGHSFSSSRVAEMRLNGRPASEFLIHAHAAAQFGVPTVFVAGDAHLCQEVGEVSPAIGTVVTMTGVGHSVIARHPDQVVEEIRSGVQAALQADREACRLPDPAGYRLEISYHQPCDAYGRAFYPGAEQIGPATISYASTEFFDVLRMIHFTT